MPNAHFAQQMPTCLFCGIQGKQNFSLNQKAKKLASKCKSCIQLEELKDFNNITKLQELALLVGKSIPESIKKPEVVRHSFYVYAGAFSEQKQNSGWGFQFVLESDTLKKKLVLQCCGPLTDYSTLHRAEYFALIKGLEKVLFVWEKMKEEFKLKDELVSVTCFAAFEMQDLVSGSLILKDKSLSVLQKVLLGLLDAIPIYPSFEMVPKKSHVADKVAHLAQEGSKRNDFGNENFLDFNPNRKECLQVVASNVKVFASCDMGTIKSFIFKNKHFIDASFLVTLAGYENALRDSLHRLPSTMYYCKSKVEGKALEWGSTTFDVLGILKVPLRVKVFLKGEEQKHQVVFLDDVVVLFQFCVPLHLSVKDPMLQRIGDLEMHAFKPEIFGKYKSHPWHAENFH